MEKSIIIASFLLILSITTTFLKNCNYDTQFPNQKLTCKILQTTAGAFSNRAPLSFATNSPPLQQFLDWFCQHKYKSKKLYSHIILFSPTISTNLKFSPKSMPHSPSNRAKRYRTSQQVNQVNPQTDLPNSINSTNLINLPTMATNATNLIPTADQGNQANPHIDLPSTSNSNPTNLPTTTTNLTSIPNQVTQVIPQTDLPNLFTSTNSTNSPSFATHFPILIPTMDQIIQVINQTDLQGPSISTNSTFLPTMLTNSTNLNHSATISHQVIPTIHQTNVQPPTQPPYYCKTTSTSSERKRIALNQVNFNLMLNKFLQKLSVKSKLIVALPSKLNHKAFKKPEFLCFLNLPKTTEQIKSKSLINLINNPSLSLSHIFPTHPAGMIHAATSIHFQPMERPKQQLLMQITSKVITPNQLQPNSNFISSEVVTPNQLQTSHIDADQIRVGFSNHLQTAKSQNPR